jgi:aminomethyltransferase
MPERRSPLYDYHLRHGGRLIPGGGEFQFPDAYASPADEHVNVRTNVGVQDLSSMGEVDIKGPGAERLINRLLVNEISNLEPGQVRYSTMCNEDGGIVDDLTVYKFSDEHFMIVTSSAPRKRAVRWIVENAVSASAYPTDITASVALLAVQGPRSRDLLRELVEGVDFDGLRFFRFEAGTIGGDVEVLCSRSGYTGELGYELYVPAEEVGPVWDLLLARGREFGLQPYGALAMQSLRIEKALPLYGRDITEELTPFNVGLDRFIRFDKREFIGRDALLRVQEEGIRERFVGLVLDSAAPADADDPVMATGAIAAFRALRLSGGEAGEQVDAVTPGEPIGSITASAKGHTVGKMLALAYVPTTHAWPGARLVVQIAGRPVQATVGSTPFFDPDGSRMRAKVTDQPQRDVRDAAPAAATAPRAPRRRSGR